MKSFQSTGQLIGAILGALGAVVSLYFKQNILAAILLILGIVAGTAIGELVRKKHPRQMTGKTKDLERNRWARVLEREYTSMRFQEHGTDCAASLIKIKKVTEPLIIDGVTIADAGYSWVQIAVEGQYVWVTAMYDDKDELVQLYFDITAGNRFDGPDGPWFEDMYLDVSLFPGGRMSVLDEDELDGALVNGFVSREAYVHAHAVCRRLCTWLGQHQSEAVAYCDKIFHELKSAL